MGNAIKRVVRAPIKAIFAATQEALQAVVGTYKAIEHIAEATCENGLEGFAGAVAETVGDIFKGSIRAIENVAQSAIDGSKMCVECEFFVALAEDVDNFAEKKAREGCPTGKDLPFHQFPGVAGRRAECERCDRCLQHCKC